MCGTCGGQAIVPFAPRNDRPIYCSSCFDKVRADAARSATASPGLTARVHSNSEQPRGRLVESLADWRWPDREEETPMGVIIIREMVGTSPRSWSDAARQAVATASKTVRNIQTVEVVKSTAIVEDGEIVEYRVEVKIGFEYEG